MTQSLWFFGSRFNIFADHTTTGGHYDLIEGYFPPGKQTPPHRHTRYSEQLYVLEGEFTVWAGEKKVVLNAGESFLISPCTPHVVAALGDKAACGLVVAAPSSFARLIAAVGTLGIRRTHRTWGCLSAFVPRLATKFWVHPEPYPQHMSLAT